MRHLKKGFTLIELLVVISIIALLMAVLVPALNSVRARAHTVVCAANLKNYGSALYAYSSNNNDHVPFTKTWLYSKETLSNTGRGGCPSGCRWHYDTDPPDGSLWPYLKDKQVHLCPTFKYYARNAVCPCPQHSERLPYNPVYSYVMNWFLGWDWAYFATLVKSKGTSEADDIMRDKEITLRLTQVKRPTQCLAFSEENLWVIPNTEYGIPYRPGDRGKIYSQALLNDNSLWLNAAKDKNGGNAATDNIATYHNVSSGKKVEGFANVVFVDGHVEAIKGLAGYDAYYEYGRPYNGHENIDPIW